MKPNLWATNHPRSFLQYQAEFLEPVWEAAIENALSRLGLGCENLGIDRILYLTIDKGRFDLDHWTLNVPQKACYAP